VSESENESESKSERASKRDKEMLTWEDSTRKVNMSIETHAVTDSQHLLAAMYRRLQTMSELWRTRPILLSIAVCCSVLRCGAVCCSGVLRTPDNVRSLADKTDVAECCRVLQCVAE